MKLAQKSSCNAGFRDGTTWLSTRAWKNQSKRLAIASKIEYFTIVGVFIIFITLRKNHAKQSEFIQIVFGERPNLSLALCSKFQLRGNKKLIEGPGTYAIARMLSFYAKDFKIKYPPNYLGETVKTLAKKKLKRACSYL